MAFESDTDVLLYKNDEIGILCSGDVYCYTRLLTEFQSLNANSMSTPLSAKQQRQIQQLCAKRLRRMPVQYVLGEWDFRDLTLKMKPPVFIPRPETEASC
ncbi:hemK methyltransferase family member 1-like [Python bivittatus]|uniref:HemK methyltransferase family member 1-like n=1 Tax=Python bivittatus TaxID=176946 RepID=A0A9F5MZI5_PYTBI|nr:hemK methyltransferase family member 1-like [Python bivittatus]